MASRVLFVDDESELCQWAAAGLARRGCEVEWRTSGVEALALVESHDFDVVVTDLVMPAMPGLDLCQRIVANRPDVPVVVMTAFGSLDAAVGAIRAGAYDFLSKPFDIEVLAISVERAAQNHRLRDEVKRLRAERSGEQPGRLVGDSTAMRELRRLLGQVAQTTSTVLVTGESGTGKEVAARVIHERSARRTGPFVALNCAAMPEALLEAELFGHSKGAFTDAKSAHTGLLVQADGGTLLLDEIGDMPLALQPKLLRALEERRVRPIGASSEVEFDVRVIAATHRDVESAVEEGLFRADLYYRLNVIHVDMPPLRDRPGDIVQLAHAFVEELSQRLDKPVKGMSVAVAERLAAYAWPGNVRELRNCIERAVALTRFAEITVDDLPERVRVYQSSHVVVASEQASDLVTLEEVERRYIGRVLEAVQGNKTSAAKILGLDRATLYRKLDRYKT